MFCVYLHFSHSVLVLVSNSDIHASWDSRERLFFKLTIAQAASFPSKFTIDQPRFQSNLPSNRWHLPNKVSASWL